MELGYLNLFDSFFFGMSVSDEYQLTIETRAAYVYAHVTSSVITTDIAIGYLSRSCAYCKKKGMERLLIYRDIPVQLSDLDAYIVSVELLKFSGSIRIALVSPFVEQNGGLQFAQSVLVNRGGLHRAFSSTQDAERWLLSDAEV